jgi:hypothetical protein
VRAGWFSFVVGFNFTHQVFTDQRPEVPNATFHTIFNVAAPSILVALNRAPRQFLLNRGEIALLHEIDDSYSGFCSEADPVEPVHVRVL